MLHEKENFVKNMQKRCQNSYRLMCRIENFVHGENVTENYA